MRPGRQSSRFLVIELLYLALAALSFYLLLISRTGEARTVWEAFHPLFIPTFFIATLALITVLFTSEKTTHKLLFTITYSVLIHSFFSIVFLAGDLSGQQIILGRTRRIFDNTILHGWSGFPTQTVQVTIYETLKGLNLQAALSTILARMLSIDIFYVHLFLVPLLWGIFVPIASFLITKALGGSENASVLASLLVSAFPYTIYFGAISVPNSLGFIFFFYSMYFMLKYLSSNDSKTAYFMVAFTFFSFLSHYLTGIISLSLLLLAVAFKAYRSEKKPSPVTARTSLIVAFLLCVSLLPLSFIYLRFLDPSASTGFTLDKIYELPLGEIVGLSLVGHAYYSEIKNIFLLTVGPALALLWMLYFLYRLKRSPMDKFGERIHFLFGAYLIMLIDYRTLKLFMTGLPINEERLWVLRDFIAAPFTALAIYAFVLSIKAFLKAKLPSHKTVASLMSASKKNILRVFGALLALDVLIPILLGGWLTFSLNVAYPQYGVPLQITWYELEAVKHIKDTTTENYVVIGDIWTVYAGEMIVGIYNPSAYYFGEFDEQRQQLFARMLNQTSPQIMVEAMNQTGTNTTVAYFVVTKTRLGPAEYSRVIQQAQQNNLEAYKTFYYPEDEEKLTLFRYKR